MQTLIKSRIFRSALFLLAVEAIGAFAIMAPILIYFRIQFENTIIVRELWPVITPEFIGDILINYSQALAIFLLAGCIIYIAYFPLKTLFLAAIFSFLANEENRSRSLRDYLRSGLETWAGFLKLSLFSILIYLTAIFIGFTLGSLFEKFSRLLMMLTAGIFLLMASSYIQILRASIAIDGHTKLKSVILNTKNRIGKSFLRILIGNISVVIATGLILFLIWSLLKGIRDFEWNFATAALSFVIQQAMVLVICLAQAIRINFHISILKRGE